MVHPANEAGAITVRHATRDRPGHTAHTVTSGNDAAGVTIRYGALAVSDQAADIERASHLSEAVASQYGAVAQTGQRANEIASALDQDIFETNIRDHGAFEKTTKQANVPPSFNVQISDNVFVSRKHAGKRCAC